MPGVGQLRSAWRVCAHAPAGDAGHRLGRGGGLGGQRRVCQLAAAEAGAEPPGEEAAAERIAGADGVGHLDVLSGHELLSGCRDDPRAVCPAGDEHQGHAAGGERPRVHQRVDSRGQVLRVVVAHLPDIGSPAGLVDPAHVGGAVGDDTGTTVGVDHHHRVVRQALQVTDEGGGHRLQREAEGAGMDGFRRQRRGRHFGERRGRCAGQVEVVGGGTVVVQLGGGERGGQVGAHGCVGAHPVGSELGEQLRAEAIVRDRAQEGDRATQSTDGAGDVVGPAPELGGDSPCGIDDEVDQRLACYDDHGR